MEAFLFGWGAKNIAERPALPSGRGIGLYSLFPAPWVCLQKNGTEKAVAQEDLVEFEHKKINERMKGNDKDEYEKEERESQTY